MLKKLCVLAAFALTTATVTAQENAQDPTIDTARYLFSELYKSCPDLINRMTISADLGPILKHRPIDNPTICKCALSRLNQDTRFINYMHVPMSKAQALMETETVKAYAIGRVVSSVMNCLALDIERSLEATPLQ